MIPTSREKKEVFVTKYEVEITGETYIVTFQNTKEKDYTTDDIIEYILENITHTECHPKFGTSKNYVEIDLHLKDGVLENNNVIQILLDIKENKEFFKDLSLTMFEYEEAYYFDVGELNLNVLGSILAKYIKTKTNVMANFKIGDKLVMLRDEDRYVSDVFEIKDICDGLYYFPYNEIEIKEVDTDFVNIEDVLWYFEAKVLDPNGEECWMKNVDDIFNKRMKIKEAKKYINDEVGYYKIIDVKPIYNLGFLIK